MISIPALDLKGQLRLLYNGYDNALLAVQTEPILPKFVFVSAAFGGCVGDNGTWDMKPSLSGLRLAQLTLGTIISRAIAILNAQAAHTIATRD